MQTERIRTPQGSFGSKPDSIGGAHYQVTRRRRASVATAPYVIPTKSKAPASTVAGSPAAVPSAVAAKGDGLGSLAAVSSEVKPEVVEAVNGGNAEEGPGATVGAVGAAGAAGAGRAGTGGPILTHHYGIFDADQERFRQQQAAQAAAAAQKQQQELQEQVQHQMQKASDKLRSQHRAKGQQQHIPMLSREFVVRRISEGESGRLKEELKCEACGKGYKHITSLAKHLWEHTPEWQKTKKLSISKHQQVQLLEAASILCSMTEKKENEALSACSYSRSNSYSASPPLVGSFPDGSYPESSAGFEMRKNSVSQYPPATLSTSFTLGMTRGDSGARKASISAGSSLREIRKQNRLGHKKSETFGAIESDEDDEEEEAEEEKNNMEFEIVGRMD